MKVYLSGKMGKFVDEGIKEKFDAARRQLLEELKEEGVTSSDVVNPASDYFQARLAGELLYRREGLALDGREMNEYKETLSYDLDRLAECDAIYMLKDWTDSPGAKVEHAFAEAIGLEVIYEETPVDVSLKSLVTEMIDERERCNAVKLSYGLKRALRRDWDLKVIVQRHMERKEH